MNDKIFNKYRDTAYKKIVPARYSKFYWLKQKQKIKFYNGDKILASLHALKILEMSENERIENTKASSYS